MKKILALLLAAVMVLGLCACGSNGGTNGGDSTKGSDSTADSKTKVSVFWYDESDVYLSSVRTELNNKLNAVGVKYDNQYAAGDQAKQLDQIKTAIAGGSNLLVVNVVTSGTPDVAKDILNLAGNIPVIFFNRAIGTDGSDVEVLKGSNTACFIGTDAPEAGHMQGKMIGDYILAHYDEIDLNKDGKISYAMMKGDEANVEAIYRTQYSVEDANAILTAAGKPELEYFDPNNSNKYQVDQGGQWSAAAATDYMETNFVTYNEANGNMIELVICNNDGMAEGVVSSLQGKGYNKDGGHVVPVFGVDATENAKTLIAEGAMTGTVKQDAEGMALAICETVQAISAGKTVGDALASVQDVRFSIASDCASKLYVAYAPYTGE